MVKKIGNIGEKSCQRLLMVTMVALAAYRRSKMALRMDKYLEKMPPYCRIFDFFSIISLYRDNWLSFLEKSLKFKAFLDPIKSRWKKCARIGVQPGIGCKNTERVITSYNGSESLFLGSYNNFKFFLYGCKISKKHIKL